MSSAPRLIATPFRSNSAEPKPASCSSRRKSSRSHSSRARGRDRRASRHRRRLASCSVPIVARHLEVVARQHEQVHGHRCRYALSNVLYQHLHCRRVLKLSAHTAAAAAAALTGWRTLAHASIPSMNKSTTTAAATHPRTCSISISIVEESLS